MPCPTASDPLDVDSPPKSISNTDSLVEYVVGIVAHMDLRDSSGTAEKLVAEFLGREKAKLFLHELGSWIRSPYTELAEWDRVVQYHDEPLPMDDVRGRDRYNSPPPEDLGSNSSRPNCRP